MPFDVDLIDLLPKVIALLFTGGVAGTLAGLLGVGGGIVIVPVLFYLFGVLDLAPQSAMHVAVGTSLATIIPTSIASMRAHFKRGSVDMDLLKVWAVAAFLGAILGAGISGFVKGSVLTAVFAVVAALVALNMATPNGLRVADALPTSRFKSGLLGFVIGTFSVMMGIGGGTLSVPVLSAFNFPIHRAVGTASALGLAIGLPGAIGFMAAGLSVDDVPPLSIGYVNLVGFVLIFPMSVLMAPVGAKLAHALPRIWLRRAFALFLAITSVRMFIKLMG